MKKILTLFTLLIACLLITGCSSDSNDYEEPNNDTKYYTVTFNTDGGTTIDQIKVAAGSTLSKPTDPTKTGYVFTVWTLSDVEYEFSTILTQDITLKALYEVQTYTISYELNGGTLEYGNNPTSYTIEEYDQSLYIPYKDGYQLREAYWCLDEELTIKIDKIDASLLEQVNSTNITLYASYDVIEIFQDTDHNGNTYSYLYYGKYPQTVELDYSITSELDKLTTTNADGYYEYNGVEYEKHTTNLYSTWYTWINGTTALDDTSYYFKVEPIKWRVIQNDGTIQVLSEYILDQSQFYSSYDERTINGETIYANNYEYSDLRTFLNDDFLNKAFTTEQQEFILTNFVDNSASTTDSDTNIYACNDTVDKIYALSYKDVLNSSYGFSTSTSSSDTREAIVTDYAIANCVEKTSGCGSWRLRSPDGSDYFAASSDYFAASYVYYHGKVDWSLVRSSIFGVRPAFTFN